MAVGRSCFFQIGAVLLMLSTAALAQVKTRSPESAKREEKLGERLVRKAVTDADEDLMESVTRLMNESARPARFQPRPVPTSSRRTVAPPARRASRSRRQARA